MTKNNYPITIESIVWSYVTIFPMDSATTLAGTIVLPLYTIGALFNANTSPFSQYFSLLIISVSELLPYVL